MAEDRKIALVSGASRGLGRGIARALGAGGATVYVTSRQGSAEQLASVAAEVDAAGGRGIPLVTDHRDADQVEAAIDRIRAESGRLDLLVNSAAAVHPELVQPGPFWEKPLFLADMLDAGLKSNYITAYFAAPLMVAGGSGLIVNISFYGANCYFHGPVYGAAKAGTDKMSFDIAVDLRPSGVACVSLWPGFVLTELVESLRAKGMVPNFEAMLPNFETPDFSGRVIDALCRDPELMELSGRSLIGAELALRYGIRDTDGRTPPSYRATMGEPLPFLLPAQ